jgi:hypothetical protein
MGYAVYEDETARDYGVFRWAGYAVPAKCDMPGCETAIDRGMGYRCEDGHFNEGGDSEFNGCGLHFCDKHLYDGDSHENVEPKPDEPRWMWWVLNHESWETWRTENPYWVSEYQKSTANFVPDVELLEELQDA